jgi:hypothetical protein
MIDVVDRDSDSYQSTDEIMNGPRMLTIERVMRVMMVA